MQAFHGKKEIKQMYLSRVRAHRKADEIVKGQYWQDGKGCAIGCTLHSGNHADYETELGIPRILARLEDGIFENLPNGKAKMWPEQFLFAIKVGADLSLVWPKFAVWMLGDKKQGVIRFAKTDAQRKSIQDVADAYKRMVKGEIVSIEDWRRFRADAYAAAYAADAYDYAADAYDYAADAYDYAGKARDNTRIAQAKKLIQLLNAATR